MGLTVILCFLSAAASFLSNSDRAYFLVPFIGKSLSLLFPFREISRHTVWLIRPYEVFIKTFLTKNNNKHLQGRANGLIRLSHNILYEQNKTKST